MSINWRAHKRPQWQLAADKVKRAAAQAIRDMPFTPGEHCGALMVGNGPQLHHI